MSKCAVSKIMSFFQHASFIYCQSLPEQFNICIERNTSLLPFTHSFCKLDYFVIENIFSIAPKQPSLENVARFAPNFVNIYSHYAEKFFSRCTHSINKLDCFTSIQTIVCCTETVQLKKSNHIYLYTGRRPNHIKIFWSKLWLKFNQNIKDIGVKYAINNFMVLAPKAKKFLK